MVSMLYTHLAAAGAALAVGICATAWVQSQHYGLQIEQLQHAATSKELSETKEAVQQISGFQKGFGDALANFQLTQQKNALSQQELGRAVLDLRGATAGLRSDFSILPERIARASESASSEYITTCTTAFYELAEAGGRLAEGGSELARQADGHAADVRLMREAWPH